MQLIRKIPWPRVLAESAIIVASILLALWVDAWWSALQEKDEELEILSALHDELRGLVLVFEQNQAYTEAIMESTLRITNTSLDFDSSVSDKEIDQLIADVLWYIEPSFTNAPLLESLVNSADIDVVSNTQLRRRLGAFVVGLAAFGLEVERESDYFNQTLMPFVQEHVNMAQVYILEFRVPGSFDETYPPYNLKDNATTVSNREFLQSQKLQNVMIHRLTILTNLIGWHESIGPQLKQLESSIGSELNRLKGQT